VYSTVVIPMVCTYTSQLFANHDGETAQYMSAFEVECRGLKNEFDSKCIKTNVEVILMLLPVEDKDKLNEELFKRLRAMQEI
jgi:hypothetical protein